MKRFCRFLTALAVAGSLALSAPQILHAEESTSQGTLVTGEFPEVMEFDFEKVKETYETVSEKVTQVTPIVDEILESGRTALEAGETAQKDPTDENKQSFVGSVLDFVGAAGLGKAKVGKLSGDVRAVKSKLGVLYAQAVTQAGAKIEELKKAYEREELKYKDVNKHNKKNRRDEITDWVVRKLYEEEKGLVQNLNRLADRIDFQTDFLGALEKAQDQAVKDFSLYEEFFAEAEDSLQEIADLGPSIPIIVDRLRIAAAIARTIPSREAAIAGFGKVKEIRSIKRKLTDILMALSGTELMPGGANKDDDGLKVIERQQESFRKWQEGEALDYRRPTED